MCCVGVPSENEIINKMMIDRLKELKKKFREARSEDDFADIDRQMDALFKENKVEASRSLLEDLKETVKEAGDDSVRSKISGILPAISVSYIARTYFHKSPAWFNQRLNGNIVNGKKVKFSEEELKILSSALQEIAEQLKTVSLVLSV